MSKVYIVNAEKFDFSAAKEYGELVPITTGNINPFDCHRLMLEVKDKMKYFNPKEDYILLVGHNILNIIVAVVAFEKGDEIKTLVYGAKHGDYVVSTIKKEWKSSVPTNENSLLSDTLLKKHQALDNVLHLVRERDFNMTQTEYDILQNAERVLEL